MLFNACVLSLALSQVWARPRTKEVCYYENDPDWCFNDDYPFDNMPLPENPALITPQMTLFTRTDTDAGEKVILWNGYQHTVTLINAQYFDPKKRTMFIVHGYTQSGNTDWLHSMKNAVLTWGDLNVIVVGWYHGAMKLWYPQSASNTQIVGASIAEVINVALELGADPKDIWCVGHSLGSHVCGHAGRKADKKIGRITGLDPAGPWFEHRDPSNGLAPDCADFVDAWHTHGSASVITNTGTLEARGHVDFYPNGGGNQPGCIIDPMETEETKEEEVRGGVLPDMDWALVCSHQRVLDLFTESLKPKSDPCQFYARQQCYDEWALPGACWDCGSICQVMGPEAENYSGRGLFYLKTTSKSPFCRG